MDDASRTGSILGVACVQVALVATWMLLDMVRRGAIFTPRAFRWVDIIIGSSMVATMLAIGVAGHLATATIPSPGDGMDVTSALLGATASAGVGTTFAMLIVVMRCLLRKATDLRTEIAEVVRWRSSSTSTSGSPGATCPSASSPPRRHHARRHRRY